MNKTDFINLYGDEPQQVTKNYATKSLGTNYNIKDCFIEFCDNSYDARVEGTPLNFDLVYDQSAKTIRVEDDGFGVSDDTRLFKLGGTTKESDKRKIGKYGIGVPGATSAIATKCVYNVAEMVEAVFESSCDGKHFEKHVAVLPNGELILGKTVYTECPKDEHYTRIGFNNVELKSYVEIMDALEETFEEPLHNNNLNIDFNGRQLGKTFTRTFIGDEKIKTINVGKFVVDVKYRIIGGDTFEKNSRAFDEAGLRIYDKNSGRLLAKSNDLWFWYGNRKAQPNICGLRAAIYIESTIESYNKFGIKPAKNGVTYAKYFNDPDFAELSGELAAIYNQASKTAPSTSDGVITIGSRTFQTTTMKMDDLFVKIGEGSYLIKKKYSPSELAEIFNEVITLRAKLEKKNNKK